MTFVQENLWLPALAALGWLLWAMWSWLARQNRIDN